ncbi:hypothetical protein EVAR_11757_1 [Eumeta japonica]|uniref:Uncharacterized protein n=1 Tax=Eumeta variegata TaxID=151549 RepID=A0A4C1UPD3_EUMVA|nr:hypothetical protein EVAR_11757_1 [Eumeta japonica]
MLTAVVTISMTTSDIGDLRCSPRYGVSYKRISNPVSDFDSVTGHGLDLDKNVANVSRIEKESTGKDREEDGQLTTKKIARKRREGSESERKADRERE